MDGNRITMLGTGNALATRCYNTCFTLHSAAGCVLLVDAGGGNEILSQLEDGGTFRVGDMSFQCFDIHSSKEPQFGFTATFANGLRLCCLGDEPFNPLCREYAQDADWLMHEAFCTYADRERFRPYEKSHSTALDAGRNAQELRARNLILYHTEDRTLEIRSERYAREAHEAFAGNIIVPDDLQTVLLD